MQSDRFAREIVAFLILSDAARSRRLMRETLGGPLTKRDRADEMHLMVMLSNAITCWRHLRQPRHSLRASDCHSMLTPSQAR
jgi:hypothetical protein